MDRLYENNDRNSGTGSKDGKSKPPIIVPPIDVLENKKLPKNARIIKEKNTGDHKRKISKK